MNYDYLHPRDEIALTISRIYRNKMTTMSGGNLSILDETGECDHSRRIDKGTLDSADIVCVRHDAPSKAAIGLSEYPSSRHLRLGLT